MRVLGIIVFLMTIAATANATTVPNSFSILSYHEVRDDVRDYPDPYAVDAAALVAQFAWLRENGYTPVSLDQIVAARRGGKPLPSKAVLLSFDDGYLSFYTRVYPVLREFRFPAVLAIVGKWIDSPPKTQVAYGEKGGEKDGVIDARFPTWGQLREMTASGLVEIASHTYDLHRGVLANPQGNLQPAATTRVYDVASGSYEDDASWRTRVRADLARNTQLIERETGRRPRAIVWPYGSYNDELAHIAGEMGMSIALTLDDGINTPEVPLAALRRILVAHNPSLADFISVLRGPASPEPVRVVQLSLDAIYNVDPTLQERNLSMLLDRIHALKPTHVYLQVSTDLDGDGIVDAVYFPTRHVPLRADLFSRVAWQLASRAGVKVVAALPAAGFRLAQNQLAEIYEDIARYANFDGLLFMQNRALTANEMTAFVESTQRLADVARRWRVLKIARGCTVETLSASDADSTRVQKISALAANSDYVVVPIPPDQTNLFNSRALVFADRSASDGQQGITSSEYIFMFGRGAASDRSAGERIARQMRELQLNGALNFGYSGDDFMRDDPQFAQMAPAMSLRIHLQ